MSKKNVEWEWKKLGDLYPISMGKTPPRADKSCWDPKKETNNVWVSIADISANENNVIYDTKEYISNKAAKNITKVEKDSLLLSFKLTIGKMAFAGVPLYTNEAIVNFPPKKGLSLAYLHKYFLYYDWEKSCEGDTKVKGKTLNKEKLKNIDVLLPPLDEQERIVKVLDDAFEKIDAIKTTAETNLQNAKDLFQTSIKASYSIEVHNCARLGDVGYITDGDHLPPPKSKQGIPFITISDIDKETNSICFDDTFYVPKSYFEGLKDYRKPKIGDVLYTVTGSYGIPVLVDGKRNFCFQRHIGLIRPTEKLLPTYLFYWILSPDTKMMADEVATGAAQKTVSLKSLRDFSIPLPPLPIQKQIVAKLDSLSEKVKQLESNYKQVLADCDELKKSILKKAFNGEL